MRHYSYAEMTKTLGLTGRRLDHWTEQGYLLSPEHGSGSGVPRTWSAIEMDVARTIMRLMAAGLALGPAAYLARNIVSDDLTKVRLGRGIVLTVDRPPGGYARP